MLQYQFVAGSVIGITSHPDRSVATIDTVYSQKNLAVLYNGLFINIGVQYFTNQVFSSLRGRVDQHLMSELQASGYVLTYALHKSSDACFDLTRFAKTEALIG